MASVSETAENVYLFAFTAWLVSFGVCIYLKYFFDVVTPNNKHLLELIERRSKFPEKDMSCKHALDLANESLIMTCLQIYWE